MKPKKGSLKRSIKLITLKSIKKEIKTSIGNKRGTVTIDPKNVRKYYEQVYVNKLDNLGEWTNSLMSIHQDKIEKFLERHTFPKVTQDK